MVIVDPGRPVVADGPLLGRVDRGVDVDLGDARLEVVHDALDRPSTPDVHDHEVVGEQHALVGRQLAEREPDRPLGRRARQPDRQPELDREVEVDVEELGPQLERAHVGVEVADVEAPQDRPLDLGPQLAADLVEVGVVPQVLDRAREAAVAVEQRRGLGDRTPAVAVVLGVEREVHADVLAAVAPGGVARPGRRDHEGGAGGQAGAQRLVDAGVRGVADAEVVAVDDQEAGVGSVAQTFGELGHPRRRYRRPGRTDTGSGRLARRARAPQTSVGPVGRRRDRRQLGSVRGVRADRQRPGEPTGQQRPVDEQPVAGAPEVDEQAAVAVARLAVALEQHRRARRQELLGPVRRLRAEALHRRPGLHRLGCVDARAAGPARPGRRHARRRCRRRRRGRPCRGRPCRGRRRWAAAPGRRRRCRRRTAHRGEHEAGEADGQRAGRG